MGWDDRFSWSGEIPTGYPGLNPVALQRITPDIGKKYKDSINPSRLWERLSDGALDGNAAGPFGLSVSMNGVNPATEKGRFVLPYFDGLWPSSGQLLVGAWVRNSYVMTYSPLLSTRGGSSPLVYVSTSKAGKIRQGIYGASGSLVHDEYETNPFTGTLDYQFVGVLLDMDAQKSRMFAVEYGDKDSWIGPWRDLSGPANPASTADLDVFSLQTSNFWTSGTFDEVIVAHPASSFDLEGFADDMALGLWSDGQAPGTSSFTVSESGIKATSTHTLSTGAERVSWGRQPVVSGAPSGSTPYWSTDGGGSWETGSELPETLDGLLRWEVPLSAGQTFSGISVVEPTTPAPTLEALQDLSLAQGDLSNRTLVYTSSGAPTWSVEAASVVSASVEAGVLSVVAGFQVGEALVTVTLTDEEGRSVSQTFTVDVAARAWVAGEPPNYPYAPIVLSGDDHPEAVIIDPISAIVIDEVNGESAFELIIPTDHKHSGIIRSERVIEVAGERYRTRRITTERAGNNVMMHVYAEARFYDLAVAGQIDAQEFNQVSAGDVMATALKGTGWSIGVANVTTTRTYEVEDTNPLALLREVQKNHGGELLFDNNARKVSLVTQSGRDNGVGFFYGKGVSESKRVVDTTSLVTRIYARNAEGLTISKINGGKAYLEDYSFTDEVRTAVYDFKSGTSPYTMLNMARATLENRSKPSYSYEVTVSDLSARTGDNLDRFAAGDRVTVVDPEVGIVETQKIVKLDYDVVKPWASRITLSSKLRELGGDEQNDSGVLDTGATVSTFDLVPFNLLLNSRFDNQLAHWAHYGAEVVEGRGTGDYAVKFSGSGTRWIEQTIQPDNRSAYALSFDLSTRGPSGWVPNLSAQALVTYEDGTSETIDLDLV